MGSYTAVSWAPFAARRSLFEGRMKRRLLNAAVCSDVLYHAVLCGWWCQVDTTLTSSYQGRMGMGLWIWNGDQFLCCCCIPGKLPFLFSLPASLQRSVVGRLLFNWISIIRIIRFDSQLKNLQENCKRTKKKDSKLANAIIPISRAIHRIVCTDRRRSRTTTDLPWIYCTSRTVIIGHKWTSRLEHVVEQKSARNSPLECKLSVKRFNKFGN